MYVVLLMIYDHEPQVVAAFSNMEEAERLTAAIDSGRLYEDEIEEYDFYTAIEHCDLWEDLETFEAAHVD